MITIETKVCSKCGKEYPITRFSKRDKHSLKSYCMLCEYEYRKKRYRKNITLSRIKGVIRNQIRESNKLGLKATFTEQQWECTKQYFNNSCAYCGNDKVNLEQDHLIPMSKGGNYVMGNIIPACRSCNSSKRNKDFMDWYKRQSFFNAQKAIKILNFKINYKEE